MPFELKPTPWDPILGYNGPLGGDDEAHLFGVIVDAPAWATEAIVDKEAVADEPVEEDVEESGDTHEFSEVEAIHEDSTEDEEPEATDED